MKFWPTPCSEFPNDNPELHDGAVWHCAWTRAKPRAVVPAASTARKATSEPPPRWALPSLEAVGQLPLEQPAEPTIPCPAPTLVPLASGVPATRSSFDRLQSSAPLGEVIAEQPILRAAAPAPRLDSLPAARQSLRSGPIVLDAPSTIVAEYPSPDDPFIAELQALVDPLGHRAADERAGARRTTLRVPRPTDFLLAEADEGEDWETFVDDLLNEADARPTDIEDEDEDEDEGSEAWFSSLSLRAVTELQERELAALEREVAELRALHTLEGEDEPSLDAPVSQTIAREARDTTLAAPDFEPLSLEAFLSGETRVEAPTPPVTHRLDPLELEFAHAPEADPAWQALVNAVSRFLLDDNATRAAALVPGLLEGRALNLSRLSDAACDALRAAGIAADKGRDLVVTREFRERCARLREAFTARRLDVDSLTRWLATIIVALLGTPDQELQVLSRLRASHVAAAIERAA